MSFQWQPAILPALRRRAHCKVLINGKNVTSIFEPYLISVTVMSKMEGPDMATIELDDREARLAIPPRLSEIHIELGWESSGPSLPLSQHVKRIYQMVLGPNLPGYITDELPWSGSGMMVVFEGGVITSVESGFSRRGGGRRLYIDCKTGDDTGKIKQPMLMSKGTGDYDEQVSITSFLSQAAQNAGFTFHNLGASPIKRPFWLQDNESFMHLGARLAAETGMAFRVLGKDAYLMPKNLSFSGTAGPTVEAIWGVNLIAWRIKPFTGRPEWSGAHNRFFDKFMALWKRVDKDIGGSSPFGGADAIAGLPSAAPNEHVGEQSNDGMDSDSQLDRGTGWLEINGEPAAQAKGSVMISGARPGVDGNWLIQEAQHNYTRGGGYTTRIDIRRPQLDSNTWNTYNKVWNDWLSSAEADAAVQKQIDQNPTPQAPVDLSDVPLNPIPTIPPTPPISY